MTVSSENRQHNTAVTRRHVFYVLRVAELHDGLTRYRADGLSASRPVDLCQAFRPRPRGEVSFARMETSSLDKS